MSERLALLCGQLLTVGLSGPTLTGSERRALVQRGGVVLFKRNVPPPQDIDALVALTRAVAAVDASLLIAIDQEGGRVVRIGPPALALPPMRRLGDLGDLAILERVADAQARELAAMGITMSFAPVVDVHTRPENPIIGDRAFGGTPEDVARRAGAWAKGLSSHVLTCAKHFPGHGDTAVDSHLALPRVERTRPELDRIEIAPFRDLARAVDSMMTAHVVYPALDPGVPATLSHATCTDLLRRELGFEGVLFSDDLEMKAIQKPVGEAAVLAIAAGCDALLVCSRTDLAQEAQAALVRECEASAAFRARCEEAHARFLAMRMRRPSRTSDLATAFAASRAVVAELRERLAR